MNKWPIFICYRQSDGVLTAERIFNLLQHQQIGTDKDSVKHVESPHLDVYFDQAAPGVGDWTAVHEPYLKRARAIIIICTPGAKLNEGSQDWVHREIDWWLEQRDMSPILIDPLGEGARYVPERISKRWPNAQRIKLIEKEWEGLTAEEKIDQETRIRNQIVGAIVPSGEGFYRQELEQERDRVARLRRMRQSAVGIATAFAFLAVIAIWIYNLKLAADEAAIVADIARQSAETAADKAVVARNRAEAAQRVSQFRAIEIQAARTRAEAEILSNLRLSKKYKAHDDVMEEWEDDFKTLSESLRKRVQSNLPVCQLAGRFSVYEGQLVAAYLDDLQGPDVLYAYLAVVPASGTEKGQWAPSVLDLFFTQSGKVSPGRDLSRNKVKGMMKDVPEQDRWALLIGLGTPHIITYKEKSYRIRRIGMNMRDDGDIISEFEICHEEPIN
jgi:hypothetical protein